jgi:hypothetical protein
MLRCVAVVRTDVSEELSASFIRVTIIGELRTTLALTSNRRRLPRNISPILLTLMKEAQSSSETSDLIRAKRHNFPEDAILLFSSLSSGTNIYAVEVYWDPDFKL